MIVWMTLGTSQLLCVCKQDVEGYESAVVCVNKTGNEVKVLNKSFQSCWQSITKRGVKCSEHHRGTPSFDAAAHTTPVAPPAEANLADPPVEIPPLSSSAEITSFGPPAEINPLSPHGKIASFDSPTKTTTLSPPAETTQSGDVLQEETTDNTFLLDLDQIFIPTLPTMGDDPDKIKDGGRFDLDLQDIPEDSPGILTIGKKSPWEAEETTKDNVTTEELPYGTWKSPVSSEMATEASNKIVEAPMVDPVTGYVFWCEEISSEEGHNAVFQYNPETKNITRWTPHGYDVRTRVHEYGGGAFLVYNNTLFFSRGEDSAVYRQAAPDAEPSILTNTSYRRYADGSYSPQLDSLFYVVEDHDLLEKGEANEPENGLVMIDATTGAERVVAAHADFFSSPRVSKDGNYLVWVQWNHPQMPWDETKVFVGEIKNKEGKLAIVKYLQHGSMMTPSFGPNNDLFYVHDSTGWWNLYVVNRRNFEINLTPESQEVGWPMWQFGRQAYDVNTQLGSTEVVVISGHDLTVVDMRTMEKRVINTGYSTYSHGVVYSKDGKKVYVVAGDGARVASLIEVDLATGLVEQVSQPQQNPIDSAYISIAQQIQFPTTQGDFAYGYLYMPKNRDYHAPAGSKPPLLVKAHQGPTDAASTVLNLEYQFFTSRGFTVLDVDYRGSTGYGKLYRAKLHEMWGVYDVDDVLAGASYLVKEGLVDENMLCIDGHSAGGYTTLSALTITDSVFKVGASYYGVSDLQLLAKDTHKFESRYMDLLIGKMDQFKDRYITRSPLNNYKKLDVPIIFFQGTEDKIVPPNQARKMYDLVKSKGLPTSFVLFEGEGHYFIDAKNRKSSLEAEIFFFSQVFNFTLADVTSDVVIDNLETWRTAQQQQQEPVKSQN